MRIVAIQKMREEWNRGEERDGEKGGSPWRRNEEHCLVLFTQANAALEDIERLKRQRSLFRNRDTEKIVPSHEP
jgi:hypothetical protein